MILTHSSHLKVAELMKTFDELDINDIHEIWAGSTSP